MLPWRNEYVWERKMRGMKIIDREMVIKESIFDKSNYSLECQASFNSDGNITLRNYSIQNKNSDEILILSAEETHAIIKLFYAIDAIKNNVFPFWEVLKNEM